jgi:hypothetical protein
MLVIAALAVPVPHTNVILKATPMSSLATDGLMRDITHLYFLYMSATFPFGAIQ